MNQEGTTEIQDIFGSKAFNYAKPVSLIRELVRQSTGTDGLVPDCFAGSATTAQAVMELNAEDGGERRFIMVSSTEATKDDTVKNICRNVTAERIRRLNASDDPKYADLAAAFAYLRTKEILFEDLDYDLRPTDAWTALEALHGLPLTLLDPTLPWNAHVGDEATLVLVDRFDAELLVWLKGRDHQNLVVYAWAPGQIATALDGLDIAAGVQACWWPMPGMWLNEGGQSAAGAAIDHLLTMHPAFTEAAALAKAEGLPLPVWLATRAMTSDLSEAVYRAKGLLVVPEFMGNRAPFANPDARALIAGISMDRDIHSLTALYVAGICGLGYGLRQIVDAQANQGAKVQRVVISGGAGGHDLVRQLLADATGLPVVTTETEEPVLLGSAILGAVAGGHFASVGSAMAAMSRAKATFSPASGAVSIWHSKVFCAFETLQSAAHAMRRASHLPIEAT